MALRFLKMHGLGNDFVVLDARAADFELTPERRRTIADRRLGVGCHSLRGTAARSLRGAQTHHQLLHRP